MLQDFAELHTFLKSPDLDKSKIRLRRDEGVAYIFHDDDLIFQAEEVNFVHAFFMVYGIDVDQNLEDMQEIVNQLDSRAI